MSANHHRAGGWITVDWTIIALSLFAIGLLLATTIRTDPLGLGSSRDTTEGLRLLTPEERLIAFEDFSAGAHGWQSAQATAGQAMPGILGPFRNGSVEKSYRLPRDAVRVLVTLDLHLGAARAGEALSVELDGSRVLLGLSSSETLSPGVTIIPPEVPGPGNPWRVRMALAEPPRSLTIRVARPDGVGLWGLDTVWVVAEIPRRDP